MGEAWFSTVESKLYEYSTVEHAIKNITARNDPNELQMLARKEALKNEIAGVMLSFTEFEAKLFNGLYMDQVEPKQMENILCVSESTFYRKKRAFVKKVAQYMGYV